MAALRQLMISPLSFDHQLEVAGALDADRDAVDHRHKMYRQLMKENLQLERSCALLYLYISRLDNIEDCSVSLPDFQETDAQCDSDSNCSSRAHSVGDSNRYLNYENNDDDKQQYSDDEPSTTERENVSDDDDETVGTENNVDAVSPASTPKSCGRNILQRAKTSTIEDCLPCVVSDHTVQMMSSLERSVNTSQSQQKSQHTSTLQTHAQFSNYSTDNNYVDDRIFQLETLLKQVEESEKEAWSWLEKLDVEKVQRVHDLENFIGSVDCNKSNTSEAIAELLQIECLIRQQLNKQRTTGFTSHTATSSADDVDVDNINVTLQQIAVKLKSNTSLDWRRVVYNGTGATNDERCYVSPGEESTRQSSLNSRSNRSVGGVTESTEYQGQPSMSDPLLLVSELQRMREIVTEQDKELTELRYRLMKADSTDNRRNMDTQHSNAEVKVKQMAEEVKRLNCKIEYLEETEKKLKHELEICQSKMTIPYVEKMTSATSNAETNSLTEQFSDRTLNEYERIESQLRISVTEMTQKYERVIEERGHLTRQLASLENVESELKNKLSEKDRCIDELNVRNAACESEVKKLAAQVEFLTSTNETLMDDIDDTNIRMSQELSNCRNSKAAIEAKCLQLETECQSLKETVGKLLEQKSQFEKFTEQANHYKTESERLQHQLDVLLASEDKLMDKLSDKDETTRKLMAELSECKTCIDQQNYELQRSNDLINNYKTLEKRYQEELENSKLNERNIQETERNLLSTIRQLEMSEAVLKTKMSSLESDKVHAISIEATLRHQIKELERTEKELRERIAQLEKSESSLQSKVLSTELCTSSLVETLKTAQQLSIHSQLRFMLNSFDDSYMTDDDVSTHVNDNGELYEDDMIYEGSADGRQRTSPQRRQNKQQTSAPNIGNNYQLEQMTKIELLTKIRQLERKCAGQRNKIHELSGQLNRLRMESDDIKLRRTASQLAIPTWLSAVENKYSSLERQVNERLHSDVSWQMQVSDLQKKEAYLKSQLREAIFAFQEQEAEFRHELEMLEDELLDCKKREARLKTKVNFGANGETTADSSDMNVAKLERVQQEIIELELIHRRLERKVNYLREEEALVHNRMYHQQTNNTDSSMVNNSNGSLTWTHATTTASTSASIEQQRLIPRMTRNIDDGMSPSTHINRIHDSTESFWLGLAKNKFSRQSTLIRIDPTVLSSYSVLDSPEAVLKLRIRELEKHERQLKQQVNELEDSRNEQLDISNRDKSLVHELTVRTRQLELSESSLKQRLQSLESEERRLQMMKDSAEKRAEDLESLVRRLKSEQQSLNELISTLQHTCRDYKLKLDEAVDTSQQKEHSLKKLTSESAAERAKLQQIIGDLQDNNKKLDENVYQLRCDLKELQARESSQQLNLEELTYRITIKEKSEARVREELSKERERLEAYLAKISELEQNLHRKELEKQELRSSLNQSDDTKNELLNVVSDLKQDKDFSLKEISRLSEELRCTVDKVSAANNKASVLEEWLNECKARNEQNELQWAERLQSFEDNEKRLRQRLAELEREISIRPPANAAEDLINNSKATQVRFTSLLTPDLTVADVTYLMENQPEFKQAVDTLCNSYPAAYSAFMGVFLRRHGRTTVTTDNRDLSKTTRIETPQYWSYDPEITATMFSDAFDELQYTLVTSDDEITEYSNDAQGGTSRAFLLRPGSNAPPTTPESSNRPTVSSPRASVQQQSQWPFLNSMFHLNTDVNTIKTVKQLSPTRQLSNRTQDDLETTDLDELTLALDLSDGDVSDDVSHSAGDGTRLTAQHTAGGSLASFDGFILSRRGENTAISRQRVTSSISDLTVDLDTDDEESDVYRPQASQRHKVPKNSPGGNTKIQKGTDRKQQQQRLRSTIQQQQVDSYQPAIRPASRQSTLPLSPNVIRPPQSTTLVTSSASTVAAKEAVLSADELTEEDDELDALSVRERIAVYENKAKIVRRS